MADRLTEALKQLIPENQIQPVAQAVQSMLTESKNAIHAEYKGKLEEAYSKLDEEVEAAEAIAENGYRQAYEIIADCMNRLAEQREEFENALDEGFNQAYAAIEEEKSKNNNIEVELYDEFDGKLKEMKEFMIEKLDLFMEEESRSHYEEAHRHIMNDPRMVEHKVAVEQMADILGQYMAHDNYSHVVNKKLEESAKQIEELRGQLRVVESRNVRLHGKNSKLNEQVREAKGLLTEAAKVDRKERTNRRRNASGRGQRVAEESLITEFHNPAATQQQQQQDQVLTEGHDELNDLLILSGIEQPQ
jgi:hypothetical protein